MFDVGSSMFDVQSVKCLLAQFSGDCLSYLIDGVWFFYIGAEVSENPLAMMAF
jgi:hypothetical protein